MKRIIWWFLFIILIGKLTVFVFDNKSFFLRSFDPAYFADLYSKSQYVLGSKSQGGIGDDGLYAFAGYYYLFSGGDVSSVNFEHPPLGKYLIGLSIFLFQNENVINLIYFGILLFTLYRLARSIHFSSLQAIGSVLLFSLDPLFLDHLLRSQLDLPFTLFFTLGVYFFLKGLKKAKFLFWSHLFWGMAFATRFFPVFVLLYLYLLGIILFHKKKFLSAFFISSLFVPLIYLVSHISFFVYHPSFVEFLRHKKWMLAWFIGTPVVFGNIWRNIFTGTYIDSVGKLVSNEHWNILLPIIFILSLGSIVPLFLKQGRREEKILCGLSIGYLVYLTVATGGLQKFLMPIYPAIILLAVTTVTSLYSIITLWKKQIISRSKAK